MKCADRKPWYNRGMGAGGLVIFTLCFMTAGLLLVCHANEQWSGLTVGEQLYQAAFETGDLPPERPVQVLEQEEETAPETNENELIEAALLGAAVERGNVLEEVRVTWYTASAAECGKADGITASGFPVAEGATISTDWSVIPPLSDVCLEWPDGRREWYVATDTGVSGAEVDVYVEEYETAIQNGVQWAKVYWIEEGGV